jgi:putative membrane-bound dehydrogenase-like protein
VGLAVGSRVAAQGAGPGFRPLFDGRSLSGWEGSSEYWRVEGGAIVGEIPEGQRLRKNHWLIWRGGDVADFELRVRFKLTGNPGANSGIQYRCQAAGINEVSGYQADLDMGATWLGRIYDEHGRKLLVERGTRVLIDERGDHHTERFAAKGEYKVLFRENEWNDYRIVACGDSVSVEINGTLFSELVDREKGERDLSGQLAFQLHSGGPTRIEFKDVRLRELAPGEHRVKVNPDPVAAALEPGIVPTDDEGRALNLGFEDGTLRGWTAVGEAFDKEPVKDSTIKERWPNQVSGQDGDYYMDGFEGTRDAATGSLSSVPFEVKHPWGSLLVGGGARRTTSVEVVLEEGDRPVLFSFKGRNREQMDRVYFDLSPHVGKRVFVRLVDQFTGGWGHVNYDDFRFHRERPAGAEAASSDRLKNNPILAHLRANPHKEEKRGAETVAQMALPEGFEARVIAAEPRLHQPIAFTFDAKGRVWVVEGHSYPQKRAPGEGLDKIVIFEDADGDGEFESRKIFMEGLNLASGLEVGYGGVWIGAAPELLFVPDRDGDDVPDGEPVALLDGFGYQDTHETLNSFMWGPDGWLYGIQGIFNYAMIGKPGAPDSERTSLTAGVWRYHPVRHEFEVFSRGGSNPWGVDYDLAGQLFMTHCRSRWGGGATTHLIQGGHFWNQANRGHAAFVSGQDAPGYPALRNYLYASARYGHGEGGAGKAGSRAVYGGHSMVGAMVYLGDNWPDRYRHHLYSHNLHGHQINRQVNLPEGSGYHTVHAGRDVLYCADPAYVAVDLKYGPDGAVYFTDWVDRQHCHNPNDEVWDRGNGRLYRMEWTSTYRSVRVDLTAASDRELCDLQHRKNAWHARIARRLLHERATAGTLEEGTSEYLLAMAQVDPDAVVRRRALWALHLVGGLTESVALELLGDSDRHVRAWVIQLVCEERNASSALRERFVEMAKTESSAHVRLYLASAIQRVPAETGWALCESLSRRAEDVNDRNLPKMIWFGLAPLMEADLGRGFDLVAASPMTSLGFSANWYASKLQGEGLERTLKALAKTEDRRPLIEAIALGLRGQRGLAMPKAWPDVAPGLYASADARIAGLSRQLGATFGDTSIYPEMRRTLADARAPLIQRKIAFGILADARDPEATPLFVGLLDDNAFRMDVIRLLAGLNLPGGADLLIERFDSFGPQQKAAALDTLTQRESLALPLLGAIENGVIDRQHLTAYYARALSNLRSASVDAQLESIWGRVNETPEAVRNRIDQLATDYATAPLWAFRVAEGAKHYQNLCASCHQPNQTGVSLGPDLRGSGSNGAVYFLENILDPNAVVGADFELTIVTKHDGQVLAGMIESQTDSAMIVRTITESVTVAKSEVKEVTRVPQSMMPPGLLDTLNQRQIIELLKYLNAL